MPVFVLDIADNNGSEWHILAKQQLKHKPTTFAQFASLMRPGFNLSLAFGSCENKALREALYPEVIFSASLTALNGQYCFDNV